MPRYFHAYRHIEYDVHRLLMLAMIIGFAVWAERVFAAVDVRGLFGSTEK